MIWGLGIYNFGFNHGFTRVHFSAGMIILWQIWGELIAHHLETLLDGSAVTCIVTYQYKTKNHREGHLYQVPTK